MIRQRALDTPGMSWIMTGRDVIDECFNGPQNSELADITLFADGRDPAQVVAEVVDRLGGP
ncbi:MAG: hypothetical protein ACR2H3_09205 [Acidimicrobiales bacterium]